MHGTPHADSPSLLTTCACWAMYVHNYNPTLGVTPYLKYSDPPHPCTQFLSLPCTLLTTSLSNAGSALTHTYTHTFAYTHAHKAVTPQSLDPQLPWPRAARPGGLGDSWLELMSLDCSDGRSHTGMLGEKGKEAEDGEAEEGGGLYICLSPFYGSSGWDRQAS